MEKNEISSLQKYIWLDQKINPHSPKYNIGGYAIINSCIDFKLFKKAVSLFARKHTGIKNVFQQDGGIPFSFIHKEDTYEGIHCFEENNKQKLIDLIRRDFKVPFNIENHKRLFKIWLVKLNPNTTVWYTKLHHLIADGYSFKLLFNEISIIYNSLKGAAVDFDSSIYKQFNDHVIEEKEYYNSNALEKDKEFWKLKYPEFPRLIYNISTQANAFYSKEWYLCKNSLNKLQLVCQNENVSVFNILLAAFSLVLSKFYFTEEINIGTPILNRLSKTDRQIFGPFINLLPLQIHLTNNVSFLGLIKQIKRDMFNTLRHQRFQQAELIKAISFQGNRLYDVRISYENFNYQNQFSNYDTEIVALSNNSEEDPISVHIMDYNSEGLKFRFDIAGSFVPEYIADEFIESLGQILENTPDLLKENIHSISITTEKQIEEMKAISVGAIRTDEVNSFSELWNKNLQYFSSNEAVIYKKNRLTYAEIGKKVKKVSEYLLYKGIKKGERIGVLLDRSVDVIPVILGVLESGATYVPIEKSFPKSRKEYIIEDSTIELLLVDDETSQFDCECLPLTTIFNARIPLISDDILITPEDEAYIIYTSGSMGKPKGVSIKHESLIDYTITFSKYFDLDVSDRIIQQSSFVFDTSIEEIFPVLSVGGTLVISDNPKDFHTLCQECSVNNITLLSTNPYVVQYLNTNYEDYGLSLKTIISGGDMLKREQVINLLGKVDIYNTYGPTESTVCATYHRIAPNDIALPIGKPIANRKVFIVSNNDLLPKGALGEIVLAGKGLANGYINRNLLTESLFVEIERERVYKTGDLGKWDEKGNLFFYGRKDNQLSFRGYRIEPLEVEETIKSIDSTIINCHVTIKEILNTPALIAYILNDNEVINSSSLRKKLQKILPTYMVPNHLVHLKEFPLSANGKIDSKRLPIPKVSEVGKEMALASTIIEKEITQIWNNILNLTEIDIHTSFFELGGHSLLANQFIAILRKNRKQDISLREFYKSPTIHEIAKILESKEISLSFQLQKAPIQELYPLSYPQERIWFLNQLNRENKAYYVPRAIRIFGKLDVSIIEKTFTLLIEKHEILRTVFIEKDGIPYQKVLLPHKFHIPLTSLEGLSVKEQEIEIQDFILRKGNLSFDLEKGPLLRAYILKRGKKDSILIFCEHHLIHDGWTQGILLREFIETYSELIRNPNFSISKPELQFKDFSYWQKEFFNDERLDTHLSFWKEKLKGHIPVLELPQKNKRPKEISGNGELLVRTVSNELSDKIRTFSLENNATSFITMLAAFKTTLSRFSNETDICVGTTVANRRLASLNKMLGMVINTIALRTKFGRSDSLRSIFEKCGETCFEAYGYEDTPFGKVVESVAPKRSLGSMPIFQYLFSFMNTPSRNLFLPNLELEILDSHNRSAKFDINVVVVTPLEQAMQEGVTESNRAIIVEWEYNSDIYSEDTMQLMLDMYFANLEALVSTPDIPFMDIDCEGLVQEREFLEHINATSFEYPKDTTIIELFETQVTKTPYNTALVFEEYELTYLELNELANQLADYLNQNCKPQPDQLIAIQLERNQWMVTAILAVLKTGAAYLPIDPEYPEGRIRYMLRDSQAKGIINQEFLSTFIDQKEQYTKEDIPNKATENNLAYVIYTSGSTGKPKGVMIEHKSLTNFITSMTHLLDINVNSKLISTTTYAFDIFYLELFSPLVVGGTTILSKSIHKLNPDYLKLLISKYQPSHIQATPTTWKLLTEQGWENEEKTTIISGGEAIQDSLKNALTKLSQSKVWNLYGPTETTIWSTAQTLKFNQKVNIGTPIANTQIYILDNNLNRLPKGVAGELCISGDGLARGYLNRPELNKEKFISNPFKAGHKLYKTGDLCRWLPDGNIEFLGRKDNQVKIRGHRIELGEIENTILELDQIKQCVVLVKEDVQNKDLLAYYTCEETFDKDSIRTSLSQSLPTYMVPNHFINLEDLPLTPNGKIDKKALPDPQTMQLSGGTEYVAPRTEKEQQLVDIWEEVLDRENIGVKDDFFELGGHSLKMMRLVSSYHKKLNVRIHLSDLFIHTSLESHTGLLAKADQSEHIAIPLVPVNEENSYPVSDAQRRLWVLSQFDGGSIPYNMPGSMVLDGSYDVDSFTRAIYSVLERHEILRTVFREKKSGEVRQFILDRADLGFDIEYKDYRSAKDSKERVREYIEGDSYKEFDLESGPLLRSALLHVEDDKYIFYYNMHHIISDGWSKGVLSRDVLRYYNLYLKGEESAIPGLRIQYKDYACWQLSQLEEESFAVHRNYWLDTLSGEIPLLDLPSKKKRPKLKTNNGHALSTYINADVTRKLLRFSRENNGSLFMSLLATWNVLMYRYTSQKDIIIGSPIAGREHTDLKDQIGFYVNTLVFRNQVDPEQSFTSFYKGVIKTTLTGFSHQAYPFDRLVEDLDVRKDPSRSAVFDIMLILQNNGEKTEGFHLNVNHINQIADEGSRPSKFDLLLNFQEQGDVIAFTVEYNTDVYERDMVEMLIKHYKALLISIMLKPEEQISNIDYLSQEEKTTLISSFNDTKFEYLRDKSIVDLFEEQVLKGPNDISLVLENDEIEYEELNELANQIAHFLLNEVKLLSEEKVGVMLHPSFWSIASIIGILKAGGAYVPLDPSLPEQRLKYMLDETETRALITEKNFIEKANRLQWTSNRLQTYLCVDTLDVFNEKEKEDNLLMEQKLWDHIGERSEDQISGGGWISSYTGIPLSTIEMEEYSMNVFKKLVRILHSEMRVLEIGCSSGLTLHKIAPEVAFYYGIDLSPIIISKLSNHLENWGFKNVKLKQLQAHEISQIKEDSFDLIIINSVIQYFHGHNYLRKVINDCVELMKDNGQIFIGDVMDINKRDDLISDLKLFKLENKNFTTKTEFSSELFVSRNFFKDLVIDYSHVCGVSISDKIYTIENELTKFRYDVILEVDKKNKKSGNQTKKKRQYSQTILKNQSKLNPDLTIQSNNLLNIIYTSGSTGKPKGVMTTHSNLVSFLTNLNQSFGFTKGKRIAATTNMSFDIFGLEVFGSLCNGCELVLFSDKDLMDPLAFMDRIHECKVEVLQLTPSRLLQVYNSGVNFSLGLKFLLVAGEALSYSLYERLKQESFRSCNSYGPTETTIYSTSLQLKESTFLSIGKPLNNEEIYILDQNNMMQPIGVIGEICIGGEGLARGYLNRPDLTSEKFVLNPFKSGERMYRTGDLGRWLEDGNVEFIGRNDDQVKIRGYRIELGEIEHALLSHEAIDQAIVMARDSVGSGDKELIAYLISKSCQNTVELRSYLSERLPSYMVPSHFVKLDAFPLTSNGKVDRKGFPSPDGLGIDSGVAYVAPRNEIEEQLVKIWEELFGKEKIGVKDDFFELGGHSLKMMRLVSSYHKAFNIKVDLGDLFTHTSLESHTGLLAKEDLNEHFAIAPVPASDDNGYPISDAQRRLWVLAQFEGGSVAYNMPGSMPLDGSYDMEAFKRALYAVIERHEILRTVFREQQDGTVKQVVLSAEELDLTIDHRDYRKSSDPKRSAEQYFEKDAYREFDLTNGPLLRAALLQLSDVEYSFYFNMHHIISDGWSMGILAKEVLAFYQAFVDGHERPELEPLRIQYRDYAVWQLEQLRTDRFEQHRQYWVDSLQGEIPLLDLPTYKQRPILKTNNGNRLRTYLQVGQTKDIKSYVQEQGGTLFMFLLSSMKVLIHKYTQQKDIVIGSPIAGRGHADLENQIGFYANTLAIRSHIDTESTFQENYGRIKENILKAYDHQMYPFDRLVEDLNLRRDTSRSALFDIMVVLQNNEENDISVEIDSDKTKIIEDLGRSMSKFDVEFTFWEHGSMIALDVTYNSDIYQKRTITDLIEHYKILVQSIVDDSAKSISEIEILTDVQRHELLHIFNDTKVDYPRDKTIMRLFEEQVAKTPDNIALIFEDNRLTYKELNELANQLACYLVQNYAPEPDQLIAVQLERSQWIIVAILAVFKTGAAYLPIDPGYPEERVRYMLEDSKAGAVIDQGLLESFISRKDEYNKDNIQNKATPNDLAYVIYTSGSTGKPKGVMVEQIGMINHLFAKINELEMSPSTRLAHMAPFTFDISVWQMLAPLLCGGVTMLYDNKTILNVENLISRFNKDSITLTETVPSFLYSLLESRIIHGENFKSLNSLIVTGEVVQPSLLQKWFDTYPNIKVVNAYGPTEASDDISHYHMQGAQPWDTVPIGKPIQNTQVYILDLNHKLIPKGVAGEICVSGDGLARGYLNRSSLTNEKFVAHPFIQGQRLYKTGDLGRWLPDGNIEFLGRKDDQVKIRGHRIELGEIESSVLGLEKIQQCVAIPREDADGNKYLIAYFTCGETFDKDNIRESLEKKLPSYMVPQYFIELEEMPLTPNGKVDKKALPDPRTMELADGTQYVPPRNEMEGKLVEIFQEVLKRECIGVYDNFYDLGGDSIKSIQIVSRLKQKRFQLKVEDVLRTPVIYELARKITPISKIIDQREAIGQGPLTAIQKRFFQQPLLPNKNHFNQSVMLKRENPIDIEILRKSLNKLTHHHDALRMIYRKAGGKWMQQYQKINNTEYFTLELHDLTKAIKTADKKITVLSDRLQASINIRKGPLLKVAVFKKQRGDLILIVIHHLVVDGVSWRILLEDLSTLYKGFSQNQEVNLPLKTHSFVEWVNVLQQYAKSQKLKQEHAYWKKILNESSDLIQIPKRKEIHKVAYRKKSFALRKETTELLQTKCHSRFNTEINDILLSALSVAIDETFQIQKVLIDLEGHGREQIVENIDITRTIGWFTSLYPVLLDISNAKENPISALIQTKENLRKIPNKGIGYGILKYLGEGFEKNANSSIVFNYLGDFGSTAGLQNKTERGIFKYSNQYEGKSIAAENDNLETKLSMSGILVMEQLQISITYDNGVYEEKLIEKLSKNFETALNDIIRQLSQQSRTFLTPSDLTYKNISIEKLFQLNKNHDLQDIYRLSPLQEGIYYHWLSNNDKSIYFGQKNFRLYIRNATIEKIKKSYEAVIQRHDILRTGFSVEDTNELIQIVWKNVESSFKFIDLAKRKLSKKQVGKYVDSYKKEDISTGFRLNEKSLIRLALIHLGNDTYEFIWSTHHIIMDGWCISILINEFFQILTALNNGYGKVLPKATPYVEYIKWLENIDKKQSLDYWKGYLKGYNQKAIIPFKSKNITDTKYKPANEKIEIQADYLLKLRNVAKTNKTTENNLIQSVWGYLLSKYNNTNDVVFGRVVSGRPTQIKGIEDMVGLFINTIPLRIKYPDQCTVTQLLKLQQEKSIDGLEHHYISLSEVQGQSQLGKNLIDHIFIFENYAIQENQQTQENQIEILQANSFEQDHYDFSVQVNPGQDKMSVVFKYNQNVYYQKEIQQIVIHFQNILDKFVNDSDTIIQDIVYTSDEQRHELLHTFNDTLVDYPRGKAIMNLFEEQVTETPDNIALVFGENQLTYKELNEKANQFANFLIQKHSPKPEQLIAVQLERNQWIIVAILAVFKTGAAYIPIDPGYPEERVQYMLEDSGAIAIIDQGLLEAFMDQKDEYAKDNIPNIATQKNLAYVIYTSGSTGKPKGVMVEQQGMINHLFSKINELDMSAKSRLAHTAPFTFDISIWQMLAPLLCGGMTILYDNKTILDVEKLISHFNKDSITITETVPSYLYSLLESRTVDSENFKSLKYMIVNGEVLQPSLVKKWFDIFPKIKVINAYGATEASDDICHYHMEGDRQWATVPIGKPIQNMYIYIVDRDMQLCPIGVGGELCTGGVGVSRGYLNREELTSKCFIANPFGEGLLYLTGDIARWLPDGNLEFLGRKDDQVKIRGHRIEIGEIENAILQLENTEQCVVIPRDVSDGNKTLIAYYTCGESFDKDNIRASLKKKLPSYMLPQYFVNLEEMPLTPNGKINKKALPDPRKMELAGETQYVPPRNELERQLVEIFQDVIGHEKISVLDDFFELGGNSIMAIIIIARINKALNSEISISLLFENSNVSKLAEKISINSFPKERILVPIQERGTQQALYLAPPVSGTVDCYIQLAKQLGESQPLYAFQCPGLYGQLPISESLEKLASTFVIELQKLDPFGPYRLGGYSLGGVIAYEMALQLQSKGFKVEELIVFDSSLLARKTNDVNVNQDQVFKEFVFSTLNLLFGQNIVIPKSLLEGKSRKKQLDELCQFARNSKFRINDGELRGRLEVAFCNENYTYEPKEEEFLDANIVLFRAMYDTKFKVLGHEMPKEPNDSSDLKDYGWKNYTKKKVIVHQIPCTHTTMFEKNYLEKISKLIMETSELSL